MGQTDRAIRGHSTPWCRQVHRGWTGDAGITTQAWPEIEYDAAMRTSSEPASADSARGGMQSCVDLE